jgi:site-specific recombinase XerD
LGERNSMTTVSMTITNFLADIARGKTLATKTTYRMGLTGFTRYLTANLKIKPDETLITDLSTEWAVSYMRYLADKPVHPDQPEKLIAKTTLATHAAALSRFYRWCGVEKLITLPAEEYERMSDRLREIKGKVRRSIISKVPADNVVDTLIREVRKPLPLPPNERDRAAHELIWLRDIALLETLKCTGGRVSEIVSLTRADLDATNRRAHVVGKGGKERWLYFSLAAWDALENYLASRTKALKSASQESSKGSRDRGSEPLFARHNRSAGQVKASPITVRTVQRLIVELAEKAGLDSNITPHKFRHWVATRLLSATGDLAATQDLLGHASPTTTRIYAQVSEQTKQNLHRQVFD